MQSVKARVVVRAQLINAAFSRARPLPPKHMAPHRVPYHTTDIILVSRHHT